MKVRALSVHKKDGELVHGALASRGWLDISLKPTVIGSRLVLPLVDEAPDNPDVGTDYEFVLVDLEEREVRPTALKDAPGLPPEVAADVTRSMDVIGDIVIIRLKDELMPRSAQIGQAMMYLQPRLRAVAVDGGVKGAFRLRELSIIAGEGPLVTRHKEHGLTYKVDLQRAYFSPRLATEHKRVTDLVARGERFLDMFCGVGPFAIMAAKSKKTSEVFAIDLNERAIELCKENAQKNGVGHLVKAIAADAREVVPELGKFDRIVMNHPHSALEYMDIAMAAARNGTTIHLHVIGRPEEAEEEGERAFELATRAGHGSARMATMREVRTYAPGVFHYCLDIVVVG